MLEGEWTVALKCKTQQQIGMQTSANLQARVTVRIGHNNCPRRELFINQTAKIYQPI